MSETTAVADSAKQSVDYWITLLVISLRHGNLAAAARAQTELRHTFGVDIRFANLLDRESQHD